MTRSKMGRAAWEMVRDLSYSTRVYCATQVAVHGSMWLWLRGFYRGKAGLYKQSVSEMVRRTMYQRPWANRTCARRCHQQSGSAGREPERGTAIQRNGTDSLGFFFVSSFSPFLLSSSFLLSFSLSHTAHGSQSKRRAVAATLLLSVHVDIIL